MNSQVINLLRRGSGSFLFSPGQRKFFDWWAGTSGILIPRVCRLSLLVLVFFSAIGFTNTAFGADEMHWTITGQPSVTFDWRGTSTENTIQYGLTNTYGQTVMAVTPNPVPSAWPLDLFLLAALLLWLGVRNTRLIRSLANNWGFIWLTLVLILVSLKNALRLL